VAIALLIASCVARLVEVVVVPHIDEDVGALSIRQHARQREYLHSAVATDTSVYHAVGVANQSLQVRLCVKTISLDSVAIQFDFPDNQIATVTFLFAVIVLHRREGLTTYTWLTAYRA
jgi:hypothetical protein